MKAAQIGKDAFRLEINAEEFRLIIGALREIIFAVDEFEFYARLGITPEHAKEIAKIFRQQADESGLDL